MPDYAQKARALRAKAADPVVPDVERRALLEKARELEAKYGNSSSLFTGDTTVTSRDGFFYPTGTTHRATTVPPSAEAWRATWNLFHNQHLWNKPPAEEDIIEENYREAPDEDEDYGYDILEGDDW